MIKISLYTVKPAKSDHLQCIAFVVANGRWSLVAFGPVGGGGHHTLSML